MTERPRPVVRPIAQVARVPVERSHGASMQVLFGPDDGASNFASRCFTLDAGGRIPAHRHEQIEHQQVVLAGELVIGLDDQQWTVRAGDCLFIPAGTAHWYENRGAVPARFLCVVPLTDGYQTEWLETTDEP